jgi:DNA-binding NtrC family response regulator
VLARARSGMSGVELIERLKAQGHQLPTIVITGSGAVPIAVQAMKVGAVDSIESRQRVADWQTGVTPVLRPLSRNWQALLLLRRGAKHKPISVKHFALRAGGSPP